MKKIDFANDSVNVAIGMHAKNQWDYVLNCHTSHDSALAQYYYCCTLYCNSDETLFLKTFFTVDTMGVVSQATTLDREDTPMHSFSVRVCDTGNTHCV